jgi:hypothetical protein
VINDGITVFLATIVETIKATIVETIKATNAVHPVNAVVVLQTISMNPGNTMVAVAVALVNTVRRVVTATVV